MDDGHEVLAELLFTCFTSAVLNDESTTSLTDDPFDDFGHKTRQAVFVGHHNSFDCSLLDSSQKPRQAFPFVVESRADVFEDFEVRVFLLERLYLTLKVVFLFFGRDSSVDGACFRLRSFLVLLCPVFAGFDVFTPFDVRDIDDVLSSLAAWSSDMTDPLTLGVESERGGRDPDDCPSHPRRDVLCAFFIVHFE